MPTESRFAFRPLTAVAIIVAVVCVIVAIVYLTTTAADLPSFFPGHQAGLTRKHVKHGLAFIGLAVAALIGGWLTTAPPRGGGIR